MIWARAAQWITAGPIVQALFERGAFGADAAAATAHALAAYSVGLPAFVLVGIVPIVGGVAGRLFG